MNIDKDDPNLTAFALGELDEHESAEVEAWLVTNEEAHAVVDDIRRTAELLESELASEPAIQLTSQQRQAIETAAAEANGRVPEPEPAQVSFFRRYRATLALAASLAITVTAISILMPSLERAREMGPESLAMQNIKNVGTSARVYSNEGLEAPSRRYNRMSGKHEGYLAFADGHADFVASDSSTVGGLVLDVPADNAGTYTIDVDDGSNFLDENTGPVPGVTFTPASVTVSNLQVSDLKAGRSAPVGSTAGTVVDGGNSGEGGGQSIFGRVPRIDREATGPQRDFNGTSDSSEDLSEEEPMSPEFIRALRDHVAAQPVTDATVRLIARLDAKLRAAEDAEAKDPDFSGGSSGECQPSEAYEPIYESPFLSVAQQPLSTFSVDVDTASYANIRRFLTGGVMPPPNAVRIEEMVNYFNYDYPLPDREDPFSVNVEVAQCPWNADHRLARIGIKGWEIADEERPPANLVFLLDVSGSMLTYNKLPLLKESLDMLVSELPEYDRVAIVVYAGASGLVLPSTSCESKGVIRDALDRLQAGGSTNGGAGIELAYDVAGENFIEGGVNRVILATDGDFNVGVTNRGALTELIEEKAKSGVFLSVLGFGMGNLKDATMEALADKGNGNYAYIDNINEAQKVLVDQMGGTLITIAKDVKIQVEFNPLEVSAYRLVGYENRLLAARDFNDDTKDAGEIGAGHTVTAFYEIVPVGVAADLPDIDTLKYQQDTVGTPSAAAESGEMMTVKLRYKQPDGDTSKLIEMPVVDPGLTIDECSDDFAFAASVASFGMLLRHSANSGAFTYSDVLDLAATAIGEDRFGYRAEFMDLVRRAMELDN